MRHARLLSAVLAMTASVSAAQDTAAPPKPSTSPSAMVSPAGTFAAPKRPLSALPYTPSLDLTSMDRSVDPCAGFLQVLLRRVEQEEPHPARPGAVGCLWEADRRQRAVPVGNARGGGPAGARPRRRHAEDRRSLRRLHGNLRDWWTAQDGAEFAKRAACVADQYAQYTVIDDIKLNSKLTLGEDVADLGGTILALQAWRNATQDQRLAPADGLTPDQRFFVGFAQWACGDERPESKRHSAITNPHSPLEYRINGVVVNMPDFAAAFSCRPGQPMVKPADKVCRVW